MNILDNLKTSIIEGWTGRLVLLGLAALGGYMVKGGVEPVLVSNWVDATIPLVKAVIPILVAAALGYFRMSVALNKMPPDAIGKFKA